MLGKEPVELKNDKIVAKFDKKTGELREIYHKQGKLSKRRFTITHEFFVYEGDTSLDNHYTFKFNELPQKIKATDQYYMVHGFVMQTLTRKVGDIEVTYTLFGDDDYIQIQTKTGKIKQNKNLVVRYNIKEIKNGNKFWTDDNGLQLIERNFLNETRGVWAKFGPMVYGSMLSDKRFQASIITDTPEAVAKNEDALEILLHRNSVQRDGNGEAMNDRTSATINHLLRFDRTVPNKLNTLVHRQLALFHNYPLLVARCHKSDFSFTQTFPTFSLPPHIHLMTLQMYDNSQNVFGIRFLNHLQSSIEDPVNTKLASSTTVDLGDLFQEKLYSLEERTLTFNSKIEDCRKEDWSYHDSLPSLKGTRLTSQSIHKNITLSPLHIKSYFIRFK